MNLIDLETLREKLERGDDFRLVMVLGERAFHQAHIPGSTHFPDAERAFEELQPEDEIVVYCSGPSCMASSAAYWLLKDRGYENVQRFAGGLEAWSAAGYALEGEEAQRLAGDSED